MDESFVRCYGWLGHLGDSEWRTEVDHRVYRERDHDGTVFSSSDVDIRREDRKQLEEDTAVSYTHLDTQAPLSMAYRLYDSCSSEKQLYVVHGANHAENYRKDPEGYENVIAQFVEEHSGALKKEY